MAARRPGPVNFTWLFQCPNCAALVLETAKGDHADWHAERDDPLEDSFIDVMMLPDEMLGTGLMDRWQ